MRQQQVMENILRNWVRVDTNLQVIRVTMPPNSISEQRLTTDKNRLASILKTHGFVYRIGTRLKGNLTYRTDYIFRKKRAVNHFKIHDNWLNKHIGQEWWQSSTFKQIEM